MCENLLFCWIKSYYPKEKANEGIAHWNDRAVSFQTHLHLGGNRENQRQRKEEREQSWRRVSTASRCIYFSPQRPWVLIDKQGRSSFLQSDPVSPSHLLQFHTLIWHKAGKCEVKSLCAFVCACACCCLYASGVWGWFKVPFCCVRTAFTNALVMQKMSSPSVSLFV